MRAIYSRIHLYGVVVKNNSRGLKVSVCTSQQRIQPTIRAFHRVPRNTAPLDALLPQPRYTHRALREAFTMPKPGARQSQSRLPLRRRHRKNNNSRVQVLAPSVGATAVCTWQQTPLYFLQQQACSWRRQVFVYATVETARTGFL
jgi:hypothetical protein